MTSQDKFDKVLFARKFKHSYLVNLLSFYILSPTFVNKHAFVVGATVSRMFTKNYFINFYNYPVIVVIVLLSKSIIYINTP